MPAMIRYLDHWATAAPSMQWRGEIDVATCSDVSLRKKSHQSTLQIYVNLTRDTSCHNHILMAQIKHLDDFLRGRIDGRLECGRTQLEVSKELGIAQSVISKLWQRFQDDGNVSRCHSTGHPRVITPNEDRYIWQLLPKETDGAHH
ncbi:uncharacterized protein TNCV_2427051 [Trichonephila clavipes]|nr:uncharacterized protein TNCV_2427051 [Trichonephila clavipes]